MLMSTIIMLMFTVIFVVVMFFAFDDIILRGYFATKLRKRFNVEDLKND